jgi:rhamnogalacturonyl hydrolase YesR
MNRLKLYLALSIVFFTVEATGQNRWLETLPATSDPFRLGKLMSERFIALDRHVLWEGKYINYMEVCNWLGALRYAELTGDRELVRKLQDRFERLFGEEKHILPQPLNVDMGMFGCLPLEFYKINNDHRYFNLGMSYADAQWTLPSEATEEQKEWMDKGFSWHTRLWIDDMYMITILQAQAFRITGDSRYTDRAAKEMVMYLDSLQRPNGLFYHAPDVPFYWGRGNGWMAAGMTELLKILPEKHPDRERIMKGYLTMMESLKKYQAKSGMWNQLLDDPACWPETSSTAMFAYAMFTGVKSGWLKADDYEPAARKAWIALTGYVNKEGDISDVCAGTNKKNDRKYYYNRPRFTGDYHGQAPMLWCICAMLEPEPQNFVFIKGAEYKQGRQTIRLGDFEIAEHPVTNTAYRQFTDATGYRMPLHWEEGKIPAGKENHPVIYVNREDVDAYTAWLTEVTGRTYRIPTGCEFDYAARGGAGGRYAYDETLMTQEDINFNARRDRHYNRWEDYLKPSVWGQRNPLGLYQMIGNVWQFVADNIDQATSRWRFRVEAERDMEYGVKGGSWASTKEYTGGSSSFSPGARCPDLGIRLVREPEEIRWKTTNRRIAAVPHPQGGIALSWALLETDTENTRFNVYRLEGHARPHNGQKLNSAPLYATSFTDTGIQKEVRYQYRVTTVDASGKESFPSEWTGITAGADIYPVAVKFKPVVKKENLVLIPVFGTLEGDGKLGCVIRMDNGNVEMSQDPGEPVQLEAFSHTGRSLWRKDIAWHSNIFGSASNAVFNVWDMDGDGKDEVITLLQEGNDNYIAILDGITGKVLEKTPWDKMETDFFRSSTRIQMSVACLDGKSPAVITQTGIYENEIISAYDNRLNHLWTYKSFMATTGSGGHKIEVADVDGDGKHEIVYGTACLNHDGTLRWALYLQHPDIISIHDYIPERPGKEICFIVESDMHAGIYMVDADTGEIIWKNNKEEDPVWSHGHYGWTADIWEGSPGMECVTNRAGHRDKTYMLFSSEGKILSDRFPLGYTPLEWDGDPVRELMGNHGKVIGKYNGVEIVPIKDVTPNPVPNSSVVFNNFVADLCGDFRSEIVISATDTDGRKAIMVLTAPETIHRRYISPREDPEYRFWLARNLGGGYGSVFEYVLKNR